MILVAAALKKEVKWGSCPEEVVSIGEKVTICGHWEKLLTLVFPFRRWKASCWWKGKILWITQMNSRKSWNRNDRKLQNRYKEEDLLCCIKSLAAELLENIVLGKLPENFSRVNPKIGLMAIIYWKEGGRACVIICHYLKYVKKVYNSFILALHGKDLPPILTWAVSKWRNISKTSKSTSSAFSSREGSLLCAKSSFSAMQILLVILKYNNQYELIKRKEKNNLKMAFYSFSWGLSRVHTTLILIAT